MTPRVECDDLVLGDSVVISDTVVISGGRVEIGNDVRIGDNVRIDVSERLVIGKGSTIGSDTVIRGRDVSLGREFYSNQHAEIGGGSCFEKTSYLHTGFWCHLGSYAMINTAMPVDIGNEVGMGRFANIYTHGAYLSVIDGFPVSFGPVSIGSRVWLPSATVLPNVRIGDDVVVGVGSVVTKDLPRGCLALGVPCRVIRENSFPVIHTPAQKLAFVEEIFKTWNVDHKTIDSSIPLVRVDRADFNFDTRTVAGLVSKDSERSRDILRRQGIRFKTDVLSDRYEPWIDL